MVFERFLRSKKLYMLFVLPVVVVVGAALNYNCLLQPEISAGGESMLPLRGIEQMTPLGRAAGGIISVILFIFLLFYLNTRYKFLSQLTVLPAVIYVLLTVSLLPAYGLSYFQIAIGLAMVAFAGLQAAICDTKSNGPVFNFGFFTGVAVLVYPKLLLLLLWAVCVLFFSGRSTLKDIVALLTGMLTSLLFAAFYYFWTDRLTDFFPLFRQYLFAGEYLRTLPFYEYLRAGILLLLLLVSLFKVINFYPVSIVNQRRGITSLMSMLFFLTLSLVVVPGLNVSFMYIMAWPLAYLYAQYFILQRVTWMGDLFFCLLLLSSFLPYFFT